MWWSDWFSFGWHWMLFGPAMMLLFVAACISVGYLVMRAAGRGPARPIDILRERFARGEIDGREFEERRRILGA